MKKTLLSFLLLSLTWNAIAERIQDTVHSISFGKGKQDHLVYLTNGRVLFFKQNEPLPEQGSFIDVEFYENQKIKSISSLPHTTLPDERTSPESSWSKDATVLSSYAAANNIFSGMNRNYKNDTECTDRAHVWSYEEWRKRGHVSKKVFLFFTETYIRRYRYHWWFHVSPYTHVKSNNRIIEYVMDRRYTSSPLLMKNWTDIFIQSKRSCPVASYRYYRNNRNGVEHCFAIKSNMYNRLPAHVREEEEFGRVQRSFDINEVNFSYRAFTRRTFRNFDF